jgi:copper chaperone CopZ
MEKKITLTVLDMHCSNCAMRLQALEDEVPGVLQVDASYQKQRMDVRFDDVLITETGIIEAVKKVGYTAELR